MFQIHFKQLNCKIPDGERILFSVIESAVLSIISVGSVSFTKI